MIEYTKSFEEKLKEENMNKIKKTLKDFNVAHLTNLNEDPLLSNQIYHNLEKIQNFRIGRKNGEPVPHMILMGIGIQKNHASIKKENQNFYLIPDSPETCDYLFINGEKVTEKTRIQNMDRIIFGITTLFIFKDPVHPNQPRGNLDPGEIDWEHCQLELNRNLNPL